jgi:hypothetical protein
MPQSFIAVLLLAALGAGELIEPLLPQWVWPRAPVAGVMAGLLVLGLLTLANHEGSR